MPMNAKKLTESEGENFDGGEKNSRTPYYCTWDYLIPQRNFLDRCAVTIGRHAQIFLTLIPSPRRLMLPHI